MSTTIDQKVVEMKFDNKHFETNIRTTMASLDKLKEKTSLKGAKQGINDVANAIEKVSFGTLEKGIDSAERKFDALRYMAIGALMNIGAQIEQTAKKLVTDLTIAPIKTGYEEYKLKMGSVQTIMASTGADIATVNKYLDELNLYADKTIYSFADMTQNIGKFTNAGVDLDKAVLAIQGVSNEAAVSGANANEASRAMYNFAQALSAGYVKLIDWKSIENANMATVEFKNELLKTAEAIGTVKKDAKGMYTVLTTDAKGSKMDQAINATRNFNDSLQYQWMTTDVLVDTLARYADETTEIGKKAFAAAQDVKTSSQLIDTLKEAAQSGWTETWQLIIGDFEEAKVLWTEVSQFFGGMIDNMSATRNNLLAPALKSNWSKLNDELAKAGINADELNGKMKEIYEGTTGQEWEKLIERYGNIGNAFEHGAIKVDVLRWALKSFEKEAPSLDKITKSLSLKDKGEDVKQLQTALKNLGYEFKKYGIDGIIGAETQNAIKQFQEANKIKVTGIVDEETLAKLKELSGETKKFTTEFKDLIDNVNKKGGRTLLIDSFRYSLKSLLAIIEPIKQAWRDIFPAKTSDDVFNLIKRFNEFTKSLKISKETAENIRSTFRGLFSIIDLLSRAVHEVISFLFPKLFSGTTKVSGGILSLTGAIGNVITGFHDFFIENNLLGTALETVAGWIINVKEAVSELFNKIAESDAGKRIANVLNGTIETVKSKWKELMGMSPKEGLDTIGSSILGFFSGFEQIPIVSKSLSFLSGLLTDIKEGLKDFGASVLDRLADFFEFVSGLDGVNFENIAKAIGYFFDNVIRIGSKLDFVKSTFSSFTDNIADSFSKLKYNTIDIDNKNSIFSKIKTGVDWIVDNIKNINLAEVTIFGMAGSLMYFVVNLGSAVKQATGLMDSISGFFGTAEEVLRTKFLGEKTKLEQVKETLIVVAGAVAILAGSLWLLSQLSKEGTLTESVIALGIIAGIMAALVIVLGIVQNHLNERAMRDATSGILLLSASLLVSALALKVVSTIEAEKLKQSIMAVLLMMVAICIAAISIGLLARNATSSALTMIGFSIALLIMATAIKKFDKLDLKHPLETIMLMIVSFAGIALVLRRVRGSMKGSFGALIGMALSLIILSFAIKMIAKLDVDAIKHNLEAFVVVFAMFSAVIIASRFAGKYAARAGVAILAMSLSLLLIIQAMRLLAKMKPEDLNRSLRAIEILLVTLAGIMAVSAFAGKNAIKAGISIAIINASLLLLVIAIAILGKLDGKALVKGISAVMALEGMFALLMYTARYASRAKSGIITMSVLIVVLTAALLVLTKSIDSKKLLLATTAISEVILSLGAAMFLMSKFHALNWKSIVTMLLFVGVVSAIMFAITQIDVQNDKLLETVAAISMVMIALAGCMTVISKFAGNGFSNPKKVLASLEIMILVFLQVAVIIVGMMLAIQAVGIETDIERMVTFVSAVAMVFGIISASMVLIKKYATSGFRDPKKVLKSLEIMILVFLQVAVIILAMVAVTQYFGIEADIAQLTIMISAITIVLAAISASMIAIKKYATSGFRDPKSVFKSLEIMVLVFFEISVILVGFIALAQHFDINMSASKLLPFVASVSTILLALSGAMAIISTFAGIGFANPGGVLIAFQVLLLVFVEIGAVVTALGWLLDKFPEIEGLLRKGIQVCGLIGEAIGAIVGGILLGIGQEVLQLIPAYGTALSEFMNNLEGFISGISNIPDGFIEKAASLAGGIAALGVASFIAAITTLGGLGFEVIGKSLGDFMTNAKPFFDELENIDETKISACKNLSGMILALTGSSVIDGIARIFGLGQSPLKKLGDELKEFAPGLVEFADLTKDVKGYQLKNVALSAKYIGEFLGSLPKEDGLWQKIVGNNMSLKDLAAGLKEFAPDFVIFVNRIKALDQKDIDKAVTAGKAVSGFADAIPNSGGLVAKVTGDNDLATFGSQLASFGAYFLQFANRTKGLDKDAVDNAVKCGEAVAGLAEIIPNQHGSNSVYGMLVGDNTMGNFGENLRTLGSAFASTNFLMKSVDEEMFDKLTRLGNSMVELSAIVPDQTGFFWNKDGNLETFAEQVKAFGEALNDMSESLTGTDTASVETSVNQMIAIMNTLKGLNNSEAVAMDAFPKFLKDIGKAGIEDFIKAFTDAKDKLYTAGKDTSDKVIEGMDSVKPQFQIEAAKQISVYLKVFADNKSTAQNAGYLLATNVLIGLKLIEKDTVNFSTTGTRAANQYLKGITDASELAEEAGNRLSKNVVKGLKQSDTESNMREAGTNAARAAVDAFENVVSTSDTEGALNSMTKSLSLIDDTMLDLDSGVTITPVLDMSNVQAGFTAMNSLFSANRAKTVSADFNYNTRMAYDRQESQLAAYEASNDRLAKQVINAINKQEPVPVNVSFTANAKTRGIFNIVRDENNRMIQSTGYNPLNPKNVSYNPR